MPTIKRLPPLPRVSDIVKLYGLRAKQQLSQNFLLDLNLTNKIVRVSGNLEGSFVCEVGPGPGSLTRSILNAGVEQLLVVEKDRRFLPSLELLSEAASNRLLIHYGDVLELDVESSCKDYVKQVPWEDGPPSFHIIGNLPFNISIPLLLKWLSCIPKRTGPFAFGRTPMTLTFQKEVAERLTAPIHHHQRSRLSIMAQTWCDVKWHFTIPGSSFVPAPKVDAAVVQFLPLIQPIIDVDYDTLETVVKAIFQHRRKIILKGIRVLLPHQPQMVHEMIRLSGVNPNLRAQQLNLMQFEQLCSAYKAVVTSSQQQQQKWEHTHITS